MLPFFLANALPTQIYFYKFDLYSATTAVNEVGTQVLSLGGTLTSQIGYTEISDDYRSFLLENILWDFT